MKLSAFRIVPALALLLSASPAVMRGEEPAPPGPPPAAASPAAPAPAPGTPSPTAPAASGHSRTGKISGTVTDAMRRTLAGLLVKLESRSDPGTLRVTSTDPKGQYHFKDLPPGVYDVRVEADGYGPGSKEQIDVRPPFQNIVDVSMSAAAAAGGQAAADGQAAGATAGVGEEGAEPVSVRGRFVDTEGRPALEVSVLLVGEGGKRLHQCFSAADGTFDIDGVVPGRYRMLVRSTGHMAIDLKSVEVQPVNGLRISLALVDFPLDTHPHASAPPEIPRPLPLPALAPRTPPSAPSGSDGGAAQGGPPEGPEPAPSPGGGGAGGDSAGS